jgi:hypothetical protein
MVIFDSVNVGGAKPNADKAAHATESALNLLHASHQDATLKVQDLQRRTEEVEKEVKALLQKGQKERAKIALRRKKVLERQVQAVQNVFYPSHIPLVLGFAHASKPSFPFAIHHCVQQTTGILTANPHVMRTVGFKFIDYLSVLRRRC